MCRGKGIRSILGIDAPLSWERLDGRCSRGVGLCTDRQEEEKEERCVQASLGFCSQERACRHRNISLGC